MKRMFSLPVTGLFRTLNRGKVRFAGEYGSRQGGFSGLTGTGYSDDGEALQLVVDQLLNISWNHTHREMISPSVQIVNSFYNLYGSSHCSALAMTSHFETTQLTPHTRLSSRCKALFSHHFCPTPLTRMRESTTCWRWIVEGRLAVALLFFVPRVYPEMSFISLGLPLGTSCSYGSGHLHFFLGPGFHPSLKKGLEPQEGKLRGRTLATKRKMISRRRVICSSTSW